MKSPRSSDLNASSICSRGDIWYGSSISECLFVRLSSLLFSKDVNGGVRGGVEMIEDSLKVLFKATLQSISCILFEVCPGPFSSKTSAFVAVESGLLNDATMRSIPFSSNPLRCGMGVIEMTSGSGLLEAAS